MTQEKKYLTSSQPAEEFEVLDPLLRAMHDEFKELSKKKSDGPVNKLKIKVVNRLLGPILTLLNEEPQRPYLEILNEDDIPDNSYTVLMLGQCMAAMRIVQGDLFRIRLRLAHR